MSKEELRKQFRGETFKNTTEKYLGGHQHYSDDYVEWLESKLTTKQESVTDESFQALDNLLNDGKPFEGTITFSVLTGYYYYNELKKLRDKLQALQNTNKSLK